MHLYLIRHGESTMNLPDHDDPRIHDVPLTERGCEQAEALAAWLPQHILLPDVIYCSSMRRTRETFEPIGKSLEMDAIFDDRIREIGNNRFDHQPLSDDEPMTYAEYWASAKPFASITTSINGESMMHFRTRVGMFLHEIMEKHIDQTVMVVCHGFVIDQFYDTVYNVGPYRNCEMWTSNTGLSHLELINHPGRERWRLHCHNRIEHLVGVGGLGFTAGGRNAEHDSSGNIKKA